MSPPRAGYDAIVAGVGGMGSAALYHLALRGRRVLGLEQFDIPHTLGSSHGVTRIIRLAYFEDPRYVPLLRRSYELWRSLQSESGETLLHVTGGLDIGVPNRSPVIDGSLRACAVHDLPHQQLTSAELERRFPAFQVPAEVVANYQPDAGFLLAERCIVSHVAGSLAAGAEVHGRERILDWEPTSAGVRVRTDRGAYQAERLVLTAGAWMRRLMPELDALAVPERQVMAWFQPLRPDLFQPDRLPVFLMELEEEGLFYGLPVFGIPGFKLGKMHHLHEPIDPDSPDRQLRPGDEAVLRPFAQRCFPLGAGPTLSLAVCMFTNSPDSNFLIGVHPRLPQVVFAAGFSGHGFKFCSVVGEILADLASEGSTRHDLGLFRLERFQEAESRAST